MSDSVVTTSESTARRRLIVEVNLHSESTEDDLQPLIEAWLKRMGNVRIGQIFDPNSFTDYKMRENVIKIKIDACNFQNDVNFQIDNYLSNVEILMYKLKNDESAHASLDDDETSIVTGNIWHMPNVEFEELWPSLMFDSNIKDEVLNYSSSIVRFALANVCPSKVFSNKVILFHGPPGTGKTTLCKAVAQKLSIRMGPYFTNFKLMEINSHSLFSKWFSESGKLVMKMFDAIKEMLADSTTLVFVLIDEVESLVKARQGAVANNEPSDALRVVNAILTQIDSIRKFPNVLILTTSNLTGAIDEAFLDRVDLMRYVGLPSPIVAYKILYTCVTELQSKNIINSGCLSPDPCGELSSASQGLLEVAQKAAATLSGRTLRKLPLIAHALLGSPHMGELDLTKFLEGLRLAMSSLKQKVTSVSVKSTLPKLKCSKAYTSASDSANCEIDHNIVDLFDD